MRRFFRLISRHRLGAIISLSVVVVWCFAYEPVTRNYVATDAACIYCHSWSGAGEYSTEFTPTYYEPHGLSETHGSAQTRCVDCHLQRGFWKATYTYTHVFSLTDLFGHFRDRDLEREGVWIPPGAARAYRVRDRLSANDSNTCRHCHVESEIEPKRERGRSAHAEALENKDTCVSCHNNMVHRYVALRETPSENEEDLDEALEDDGLEDEDLDDL